MKTEIRQKHGGKKMRSLCYLCASIFLPLFLLAGTFRAADFPGTVMASNATGRLLSPTNFFYTNLLMGSNMSMRRTNGGRMILDSAAGTGGGSADLSVTNLYQIGSRVLTNLAALGVTNFSAGNGGISVLVSGGVLWITNNWSTNGLAGKDYVQANDITTSNALVSFTASRIAASNLNYVLLQNGTANSTTITNGTNMGVTTFYSVVLLGTNANGISTFSNAPGRLTLTTSNADASKITQTATGVGIGTNGPATTLDVMGTAHIRDAMTNDTFIASLGSALVGGQLTVNGLVTANNGLSVSGDSAAVNAGLNVSGGLAIQGLTGLKLLALDSGNNAISSAYYDTDIAALIAGLGNTNLYVLNNAGKGTNNTFYSPTNTAQASNQVCQVISMLAGQKTNAWEVWSNGVLISFVASSGCYTNTALISKISNVQLNQGGVILSANNKSLQIGVGGPAVGGIGNNFQLVLNDGNGTGDRLLTLFGGINYPGFSNSVNGLELRAGTSSSFTNLLVQNLTTKGTIYAPTNTAPWIVNQGDVSSFGMALSNINGTASTSLTTGATLSSNVYSYVFSSAGGTPLTLSLATNSNYPDGQLWQIVLGVEGTNTLNLTPTNFSAGTSDKIYRSTNIVLTPGMALTLQKQGTNFNIIGGLPPIPIGGIMDWYPVVGTCTNLSSFFAQCNGQVLVDAGSPLNGSTLPNWNNGTFLRGNTYASAGGTGGASTHTHTGTTGSGDGDNIVQVQSGMDATASTVAHFHTFTTDAANNLPPYVDVIKIVRVK